MAMDSGEGDLVHVLKPVRLVVPGPLRGQARMKSRELQGWKPLPGPTAPMTTVSFLVFPSIPTARGVPAF